MWMVRVGLACGVWECLPYATYLSIQLQGLSRTFTISMFAYISM